MLTMLGRCASEINPAHSAALAGGKNFGCERFPHALPPLSGMRTTDGPSCPLENNQHLLPPHTWEQIPPRPQAKGVWRKEQPQHLRAPLRLSSFWKGGGVVSPCGPLSTFMDACRRGRKTESESERERKEK